MVKVPVLNDPVTLVALITKLKTPGVVRVPLMVPAEAPVVVKVKPPGNAPENTE
jgi:hypothetical protein